MTFEERFVELLQGIVIFNDQANEDELIAADDLLEQLLDSDNLPSSRPEVFWALLSDLISPNKAHLELIGDNNIKNVARIIDLGKKINPEKWAEEYNQEHGLSFHSFSETDSIQKSTGTDGRNTDFYHYNGAVGFAKSLAFVDLRLDPGNIPGSRFNVGDEGIQVIACLLMLDNLEELSDGCALISSIENADQAQAQLQYHLVLHGNSWSTPVELPNGVMACLHDLRAFIGDPEHFIQFREPFSMLSGVNASTGILEVFMSAYHALENYMIRSQVAGTFTANANLTLNRVRDFKRLGTRIDQSESKFLNDLFEKSWDQQIGNQSLIDKAIGYKDAFQAQHQGTPGVFDSFFKSLDVKKGNGTRLEYEAHFNGDEAAFRRNFSLLVYGIRCSIVHNKATEFHISNENLAVEPSWIALITELCMPVMLQLAFGLPSVAGPANPIRYSTPTISLY